MTKRKYIVRCTNCNQKLQVPERYLGKRIKCPKCKKLFLLPGDPLLLPELRDEENDDTETVILLPTTFGLKTLFLLITFVAIVIAAITNFGITNFGKDLIGRIYVFLVGMLIVDLLFLVLHSHRKLSWRIALFLVWLFLVGMLIVDLYAMGFARIWHGYADFQVGVLCPLAFLSGTVWLLYWMVWAAVGSRK